MRYKQVTIVINIISVVGECKYLSFAIGYSEHLS